MRILVMVPGLAAAALSLAACTSSGGSSSSSSSSSGATSSSSSSSSTGGSSGTSGGSSSNGGASSAGSTGGVSSSHAASSGGGGSSSAATCAQPSFTLCDGIAVTNSAAVTITTNSNPMGFGAPIGVTLGMTRTAVRAALGDGALIPGTGGGGSPLPFNEYYCAQGFGVGYADTADGNGNLPGTLSDNDVVVRISTLTGFQGNTDTSLHLGSTGGAVETAYGTTGRAQAGDNVFGGSQDMYPAKGLAFGYDASGNVNSISVHKQYVGTVANTTASAPLDMAAMRVGAIQVPTGAILTTGATAFAGVKTLLGQPDTEGFANAGGTDIAYLSYGSAGVRVVGLKGASVDSTNTLQVYLTPPFLGIDGSTGLGLGSTRAGWDSSGFQNQGNTTFNGAELTKYKVGSGTLSDKVIAVAFAQDAHCVDRAVLIIFNYFQ